MRIAVVGGGYVGLVSGACLATLGWDVTVIESNADRYRALCEGRIPIYEPGLAELVLANRESGRLVFADRIHGSVSGADAVFLAVGTPSRRGDGHADLTYVFSAADDVAHALTSSTILVTKSTVPVGTGRRLERRMRELRPDLAIAVASNPEFLREGSAIGDFMQPDRVVIGASSTSARAILEQIYEPLARKGIPIWITGLESAELIKYAANSFLAMKIAFINEIADLCEKTGADIAEVSHGMGLDQRIGARFLSPGPGFGGSCFPKDTQALARIAQEAGAPSRLVETVVAVNDARKASMAGRILAICGGSVRGKKVAVLGLTFKPETDDMRDAPSISIVHRLVAEGASVNAYDPEGVDQARPLLPSNVVYADSATAAISDADIVVLVTEWKEFSAINASELAARMRGNVVVDFRNVLDGGALKAAGLIYYAIGRSMPPAASEVWHPFGRHRLVALA